MEPNQNQAEQRATRAWQLRILPLMIAMIVGGAILFSVVSILEFKRLDDSLEESVPRIHVQEILGSAVGNREKNAVEPEFAVRVYLEAHVADQRYYLARTMLRARLWTRFIGFLVGMILALVGTAFVLGRLREEGSSFASSGAGLSLSMSSASPGLILAGLGTILMGLCLVVAPTVQTSDGALYIAGETFRRWETSPASPAENETTDDILNSIQGRPQPLPKD